MVQTTSKGVPTRREQLERRFGRPSSCDDSVTESSTTAIPLFSPSQSAIKPRAVKFASTPPKGDGVSTVMLFGNNNDSPSTTHFSKSLLYNSHKNRSLSSSSSFDLFLSPASHVSSIHSSVSPLAANQSRQSNARKSMRQIPMTSIHGCTDDNDETNNIGMERFSQAHISKCQSPRELQQTIRDLQSQGNYPLLVRAAQKRLYQVQQSSVCPLISEEENDDDGDDDNNNVAEDRNVDDDNMKLMEARISPRSIAASLVYSYDEERDAVSTVASSQPHREPTTTTTAAAASSRVYTLVRDTQREQELETEIARLKENIVELNETLRQDKEDFERRLRQLQKSRETLEATSHQNTETLHRQLKDMERTKHDMAAQLENERMTRTTYQQKASHTETVLRRKVQQLLEQIQTLQQTGGGKSEELNRLLKSAQASFETVKRERNTMLERILKAMGEDASKVQVSSVLQGSCRLRNQRTAAHTAPVVFVCGMCRK